MPKVAWKENRLVFELARWEACFVGFRRLAIAEHEIELMESVAEPIKLRAYIKFGLWLPGIVKVGTFGRPPGILAVVRRGRSGFRVQLKVPTGKPAFEEILISSEDADGIVACWEHSVKHMERQEKMENSKALRYSRTVQDRVQSLP